MNCLRRWELMYELIITSRCKKDIAVMKKRGASLKRLKRVFDILIAGEVLEEKYRDHALKGTYTGFRECHIAPDWLLIYKIHDKALIITAIRTGSHSDLF